MTDVVVCSNCFCDQGLKLDALRFGVTDDSACPNCGSTSGRKLDREMLEALAHRFFVEATVHRAQYGGAPAIVGNPHQKTSIETAPWFEPDLRLIERITGFGYFYYGPRLWMIGHIEPLESLQKPEERDTIVKRILAEFPSMTIGSEDLFYRLRREPGKPAEKSEYDSPPDDRLGRGRLDSPGFPVMYGSQDLQICVHECRVSVDDETFVATLAPSRQLRLLDLTEPLLEKGTEFESLAAISHKC